MLVGIVVFYCGFCLVAYLLWFWLICFEDVLVFVVVLWLVACLAGLLCGLLVLFVCLLSLLVVRYSMVGCACFVCLVLGVWLMLLGVGFGSCWFNSVDWLLFLYYGDACLFVICWLLLVGVSGSAFAVCWLFCLLVFVCWFIACFD